MEFSRQEYWSRLPGPAPGDLPDPGIKCASFMSLALAGAFPLVPPGPTPDLQNQRHWGGAQHIVFECIVFEQAPPGDSDTCLNRAPMHQPFLSQAFYFP